VSIEDVIMVGWADNNGSTVLAKLRTTIAVLLSRPFLAVATFASNQWRQFPLLATLLWAPGLAPISLHGATEMVAAVIEDFEDEPVGYIGSILPWYWTEDQKRDWAKYSRLEIVADPGSGNKHFMATLSPDLPWDRNGQPVDLYQIRKTGMDYTPPVFDAVRIQVKVLQGEFRLTTTSSTIYFGNSDVTCQPKVLNLTTNDTWESIDFDLNQGLTRNYRRAGFSQGSPVIYLSRWIQEPLSIGVLNGSHGILMIDRIELVKKGQGRQFPSFASSQIRQVGAVADFETIADLAKAFTFTHADTDLSGPPVLARPTWAPPILARVQEAVSGHYSLEARQIGHEEVAFTGIKALGPKGANAIALKMKVDHPSSLVVQCLDFVVYAAPESERTAFPWNRLEPPVSWKNSPDLAFNYYLSQKNTAGLSYGFYHARRHFQNGEWQTVVIPLADFMCAYGQEHCEYWFKNQIPLSSERITALGFLPPFRQRYGETRILIDEVTFVSVAEEDAPLRSFWQASPEPPLSVSPPQNLRREN